MIKRTIEISSPARLSLKNQQMVIDRDGLESATVPIEDMGVLILDHPQISHSQGLLSACAENNVAVIVCNSKHLPVAVLTPLEGNSLHTKTITQQVQISGPIRKQLWKAIVQTKIRAQAKALDSVSAESHPLHVYASRVKSGDPDNMEAQAARIYWHKLFGEEFQRDYEASGINALLNYGYAVVRAAVARAVVATGLHPSLGLYHHNQYNSLCLADDLLEPLRPIVDIKVYEILKNCQTTPELTKETKHLLLEILSSVCRIGNKELPFLVSLHYYAASIRKAICGEEKKVEFPEI